jgi:hypothetical protein
MIVAALGYDVVATAKGGYPTGYLAVASSENITKGANGKVGDAAKRSTIAVLVYNSLEVRLMDQSSWTSNNENEYKPTDETILSKYLEVEKYEGIVTATALTDVATAGAYDFEADKTIDIDGYVYGYSNGKLEKTEQDATDVISNLVDADTLIGKSVVAYIGEDEDGADTVYAITESKNKVTSISAIDLVDADDDEYDVKNQISYRKSGSKKVYDLDIEDTAVVKLNYAASSLPQVGSGDSITTQKNSVKALINRIDNGGRIDFISNDSDDKIEYILITAYDDSAAVIKEVSVEDGVYSFETFTGAVEEVDTTDEEALTIVTIDGAAATVADLKANYTVSAVELADGLVALYASSKTVTGTVDSYDDEANTVSIAGADYDLVGLTASALKDEEGIFFLNVDGQIVHNETEATGAAKYAIVLAVSHETGINDSYVAQVVTADGAVAEYKFASKAKYGSTTGDDAVALAVAQKIEDSADLSTVAKLETANITTAIFDITIKNGEISRVKDVYVSSLVENKKYDEVDMSYGSLAFDESTVVFALKDNSGAIDEDGVTIGKVADYFVDGEGESFDLYGVAANSDEDVYAAVLGFNLRTTVPEDGAAVIVTGKKTVTYDDDDATYITGIQAGKEVAFTIYSEDAYTSAVAPEYLAKGDIILVGAANAEGVVSDFKTLFKKEGLNLNPGTGEGEDSDYTDEGEFAPNTLIATKDTTDDIYYVVGTLEDDPKPTSTKFWLTDSANVSQAATGFVLADGITMKTSANYTVVDYTESAKYPEFDKKSAGTGVFGSVSKYTSLVFVRYYDDKIVEVIAYRTNVAE